MTPAAATFSDWLKLEVEPKLRAAAAHFKDSDVPSYLIGQAVATGIQPFLYWQREQQGASPPNPSSNPSASSLSQKDRDWLEAVGVEYAQGRWRASSYLGGDLFQGANDRLKSAGYRYVKEERGWVKA